MNGFQDLPSQQQQRFWVYTGNAGSAFQTWIKPPGISFIHIITIGAGGGGRGASIFQSGVAVRGGSGGGSGAMTSAFLPAYLVPDTLYISVGVGGIGGAASTTTSANAAANGTGNTFVSFVPGGITFTPVYCLAPVGLGGGAVAGGTAGAAIASSTFPAAQIGLRNTISGQGGAVGGVPTPASITAAYRITGGGGGGGQSAANAVASGTSIGTAGDWGPITISSSPAGENGGRIEDLIDFISAGGTGASSSTTISGSNGGWGGFGSGGGGGSIGPGRGGAGGNGGNGLVIITCG